jgi:hypothetical protein
MDTLTEPPTITSHHRSMPLRAVGYWWPPSWWWPN